MSAENVDLVRRGYTDAEPLATLGDRIAPDAVFDFTAVYPDSHHPGYRRDAAISGRRPLGLVALRTERLIDVDTERVLLFVRVLAHGKASGVPVEQLTAHEFTIRDGLLVRFKFYLDRGAALEAAGLEEDQRERRDSDPRPPA